MNKGKRIFVTADACGGSRGVADKDLRDLGGRLLIAWTVQEARRSADLARVTITACPWRAPLCASGGAGPRHRQIANTGAVHVAGCHWLAHVRS